ncbi:hypothetical protein, partial [Streptomyces brasiliscabiei]|uniref:hypothetical protein n=1 Tax=Streptomyces brasiliscabiei TaxID=2736302 RepID=UPI003014AF66
SNSLDFIPADLQASPNYIWLKDFKETEYKELNQKRKQIVHYQTTNTEYIQRHLKTIHDRDSIERLQTLRESLPDY